MVQPTPVSGNSCWAPSAQGGPYEAPGDVHRRRRRVRGRFRLTGKRAGGRDSIGRSHRRPCAGHPLGRRPAIPITLRLKLPPNYRIPPHWHAVLEHVTVLSGTLNVGMGEQPTYSGGTALSAGSYAVMPQKMVHYAWAGSDGVVFQLHSVGPWSITYVNPKDDPRQARP